MTAQRSALGIIAIRAQALKGRDTRAMISPFQGLGIFCLPTQRVALGYSMPPRWG